MPPSPTLPDIRVRADGSIEGIDGLLDQIATALGRRMIPMLRHEILPILQEDRELQERIGQTIGREIALPLWGAVIAATMYVAWRYQQRNPANSIAAKVVRPRIE